MTPTVLRRIRAVALVALMLAWIVAAYLGSSGRSSADFGVAVGVAPAALLFGAAFWRTQRPLAALAIVLVLVGALALLWPTLRAHPVRLFFAEHLSTHLALALLFGRTLFGVGEPLITRFARLAEGPNLSARKRRHTRHSTQAWTAFFLANASVSTLLYALASQAVWSFYASLLTAPLIGLMFLAEYLWRKRALPPEERPSLAQVVHAWGRRDVGKSSAVNSSVAKNGVVKSGAAKSGEVKPKPVRGA